jgi:hypothetical protein
MSCPVPTKKKREHTLHPRSSNEISGKEKQEIIMDDGKS